MRKTLIVAGAAIVLAASAMAQQPAAPAPPPPYGAPISLELANKAIAAAIAEARKNNFNMAVAVLDPSGLLIAFGRMDGAPHSAVQLAQDKAKTAALYRRETKSFVDRISAGEIALMTLPNLVGSIGGIPIVADGKLIGAIGTSGGSGAQDGQVSQAGVNALK